MYILVLDHSLVYFNSTTENKMLAGVEKEWFTVLLPSYSFLHTHCCGITQEQFKKLNWKEIIPYHPVFFFFSELFSQNRSPWFKEGLLDVMQEQRENWTAGTAQQQQEQPKDKSFLARKKSCMCTMEFQERTFLNLEHLR